MMDDPIPLTKEPLFTVSISSSERSESLTVHLKRFELEALAECCQAMLHNDLARVASAGTSIDKFEVYSK